MAKIEHIANLDDPRVAGYRGLRDGALKAREGLFVAEGRLVVRLLIEGSRFEARSVLVSEVALSSIADALGDGPGELAVYVAAQGVMDDVVGFAMHRGCVALGERGEVWNAREVLEGEAKDARLIAVAHDLTNHDNVGGVFRNAAAFGAGAVLITERCCDPLYRKAIRVSMGHALRVPFGVVEEGVAGVEMLRAMGWRTVALTPGADARVIGDVVSMVVQDERVAVYVGTEGEGLPGDVLRACDERVRIGMADGVDSLNAATASGIALHRFAEAMAAV